MKKILMIFLMIPILFSCSSNDDLLKKDSGKRNYRTDIETLYAIKQANPKSTLAWEFEGIGTDKPTVWNYRTTMSYQTWDQILFEEVNGEKRVIQLILDYSEISDLKDIGKLSELSGLLCYGNKLTSLDVTRNTALTVLFCDANQLTSLDLTKNVKLNSLGCTDNQFGNQSVKISRDFYNNAELIAPLKTSNIFKVVD